MPPPERHRPQRARGSRSVTKSHYNCQDANYENSGALSNFLPKHARLTFTPHTPSCLEIPLLHPGGTFPERSVALSVGREEDENAPLPAPHTPLSPWSQPNIARGKETPLVTLSLGGHLLPVWGPMGMNEVTRIYRKQRKMIREDWEPTSTPITVTSVTPREAERNTVPSRLTHAIKAAGFLQGLVV